VYPYFNYYISIWGNSPKYLQSLLKPCQNSFLRILYNIKNYDHIIEYCKISNLLTINQIFSYNISVLTYKLWILKINSHFFIYFNKHINRQFSNLRNPVVFKIPKFRTKFLSSSTLSMSLKFWNKLPNSIRTINSLYIFKKQLKSLVLDNYFACLCS